MTTLLGYLAQFGAFSSQGEVLCTQGLAHLLQEHAEARSAFADKLVARAGVSVSHDLKWYAEQYQESDRGKPDLEAREGQTPIVKIEAKLGARLNPAQFRSYASHLQARLRGGRVAGVLLALVPRARIDEAKEKVKEAFPLHGAAPWRVRSEGYPDIAITVISWEDVLAVLGGVESQRLRSEVEQFAGMYRELSSFYVLSLEPGWRTRRDDLWSVVNLVTRRLTTHHLVYPLQEEPLQETTEGLEALTYKLRYVCLPLGDASPCFSIGVRPPFKGSDSPIWFRFHRSTRCFATIRQRLEASELKARLYMSGRHIWMPLALPSDDDSERVVNELVAQAEAVIRIAYAPLASPAGGVLDVTSDQPSE